MHMIGQLHGDQWLWRNTIMHTIGQLHSDQWLWRNTKRPSNRTSSSTNSISELEEQITK